MRKRSEEHIAILSIMQDRAQKAMLEFAMAYFAILVYDEGSFEEEWLIGVLENYNILAANMSVIQILEECKKVYEEFYKDLEVDL